MTRVTRRGWVVVGLVGVLAFLGGIALFQMLVDEPTDRLAVGPTSTATAEATPTLSSPPTSLPTPRPTPTPAPTPATALTAGPTPALTPAHTPTPRSTAGTTGSPTPRRTSPTPKPATTSPTPQATGTTHTMHMTNFAFSPSSLSIKVGDSIRAVTDQGSHTFTSKTGPDSWDSAGASTFTWRFTVPGDYTFVCSYHENVGMTGTIKVQ